MNEGREVLSGVCGGGDVYEDKKPSVMVVREGSKIKIEITYGNFFTGSQNEDGSYYFNYVPDKRDKTFEITEQEFASVAQVILGAMVVKPKS